MISGNEAPCEVLFDTFKEFARMNNRDLASVILADRPVAGGRSPRQRIEDDKSYLSRTVVRSKPGDLPPSMFADFGESAHTLYSAMRSPQGPARSAGEIVERFSGEAAWAMARACSAYGLDGALYSNTVDGLLRLPGMGEADRAYLLVLLFLETGCLQDVQRAASDVLGVADRKFNAVPVTQDVQSFNRPDADGAAEKDVRLALYRAWGNRLGQKHVLSTDPAGTEIGYLSTVPGSITDVEKTVSRQHLLLFRAEDGSWYARGLHSRNGSVLVSGNDRSEQTVIEPPRSHDEGFERKDVLIKPGDKLVLARDTVFFVMQD